MKVFNFKSVLESNGIQNPDDCELFHIIDLLEAIDIKINPNGPWVAGGSVLRTFMGLPIDTDVDLFFPNESVYNVSLELLRKHATFIRESKFSHTFEILLEYHGREMKVKTQIIRQVYKEKAVDIINGFDLSICQIAFDSERIVCPQETIEDLKSKRMTILINNITHPVSTLKRVLKYSQRGYTVDDKNLKEFTDNFFIPMNSDKETELEGY